MTKKYFLLTEVEKSEEKKAISLLMMDALSSLLEKIKKESFIIYIHFSLDPLLLENSLSTLYLEMIKCIPNCIKNHQIGMPAISIICQAPCSGAAFSAEILCVDKKAGLVSFENFGNIPYVLIEKENIRELWCSSLLSEHPQGAEKQAESAFELMRLILDNAGFCFDDVVRQWNYIGNILKEERIESKVFQNYQVFNEVREKYYSLYKKKKMYPAATGIGMDYPGTAIAFYAVSGADCQVIESPMQANPHAYGDSVLVGTSLDHLQKKKPLFERAIMVNYSELSSVFISGTASIIGENTVGEGSFLEQLQNTLRFIEALREKCPSSTSYQHLRIYVKKGYENLFSSSLFAGLFPQASICIVTADICRSNLLVEIEAQLVSSTK